jgi:hypothetical protein
MFVLTRVPVPGRSVALGMNLRLRPISGADRSRVADFSHADLNRWRARGHAGAAVASLAEPRVIVPPPSFILSAPQLNRHKSATLEAA